jgi:hypothetical protein
MQQLDAASLALSELVQLSSEFEHRAGDSSLRRSGSLRLLWQGSGTSAPWRWSAVALAGRARVSCGYCRGTVRCPWSQPAVSLKDRGCGPNRQPRATRRATILRRRPATVFPWVARSSAGCPHGMSSVGASSISPRARRS